MLNWYFPMGIDYSRLFLDGLTKCPYCLGHRDLFLLEQCGYQISLEQRNQGIGGLIELLRERGTDFRRITRVARLFLCETHQDQAEDIAYRWATDNALRSGLHIPGPHGQHEDAPNAALLSHEYEGGNVSEHSATVPESTSFVAQTSTQEVETGQSMTPDSLPSTPSRSMSPNSSTTTNSGPLTPASSIDTTSTTSLSDQAVARTPSPVPSLSNSNINIYISLHLPLWSFRPFTTTHNFSVPFLMAAGTVGLFAMWYYRNA